jgi:hypothetical protein
MILNMLLNNNKRIDIAMSVEYSETQTIVSRFT